jgi:hydrogenase nickel incorporation protein HypA/HybF
MPVMHELSVCQALIGQVEAIARERTAQRVVLIRLGIGPLSGVEPQLLVQAYRIASAGTLADGADLVIENLPLRVSCDACGQTTDALPNRLLCAACGDWHTRLISGDELQLNSVELIKQTNDSTRERSIN